MRKTTNILAFVAVLLAACTKPVNPAVINEDGSVDITVVIDSENSTKATLAETGGAFAFTSGDAIAIGTDHGAFTGSNVFAGNEDLNTFRVYGLNVKTDVGLAAYPAGMVTAISNTNVTFTLPRSYTYSEVGSSDPDACPTPVPMIGSFNGPSATKNKVTFKQAGSVIRFKVTECQAGTLTFTFATKVTGNATINMSTINNGEIADTDEGIIASGLSYYEGQIITVSNVPVATSLAPIYITLPIPSGTAPSGIVVTNTPQNAGQERLVTLTGSATPLNRAGGYKISLALTGATEVDIPEPRFEVSSGKYVVMAPGNLMARIDESYTAGSIMAPVAEWKIGGPLEVIGTSTTGGNYLFYNQGTEACRGTWVDLFGWQGNSVAAGYRAHGLVREISDPSDALFHTYFGSVAAEKLYSDCWDGLTITGNDNNYAWRTLTNAELDYIVGERTTSGTLDGEAYASFNNARFARVRVAGLDGFLLFPKGIAWTTATMGAVPNYINDKTNQGANWTAFSSYTSAQMTAMLAAGFVFLPCGSYYNGSSFSPEGDSRGHYWTKDASNSSTGACYLSFFSGNVIYPSQVYSGNGTPNRNMRRSVRLVRDVVD